MLESSHPNESAPILPRSAWNSQLAWLKAVMKAKQALDRQEKAFSSNSDKSLKLRICQNGSTSSLLLSRLDTLHHSGMLSC